MFNEDLKSLVNKYRDDMIKMIDEQKDLCPCEDCQKATNSNPAAEQINDNTPNDAPQNNLQQNSNQPPTNTNQTVATNPEISNIQNQPSTQTPAETSPNQPTQEAPAAPNVQQEAAMITEQPLTITPQESPVAPVLPQEAAATPQQQATITASSPTPTQPVPEVATPESTVEAIDTNIWNEFLKFNRNFGILKIQVSTPFQGTAIKNARVIITKTIGDYTHQLYDCMTDNSGLINSLQLPAPSKDLTNAPTDAKPFADYDIYIDHPDYEAQTNIALVFDSVKSVQPVQLSALAGTTTPASPINNTQPSTPPTANNSQIST